MSNDQIKILIVDDEEKLRKSLERNLSLDGHIVLTAANGNEAFEIVKNHSFDLVISDVQMPNGNGEQLLNSIRNNFPRVPVVLMVTGYAEMTRDEAIAAGAIDLIPKPIDIDYIDNLIKSL